MKEYGRGRNGDPGQNIKERDLLCARLCLLSVSLFGVIDNTLVLLLAHSIVVFENCVVVLVGRSTMSYVLTQVEWCSMMVIVTFDRFDSFFNFLSLFACSLFH